MPTEEMPISKAQTIKAVKWLHKNYGDIIADGVLNTPLPIALIYAIACQETAYRWLDWIDKIEPEVVLARCVFDASGDAPNSDRSAYPKNGAMLKKDDPALFKILIAESNMMRELMGWQPNQMLYKGYGIFQYDLQFVKGDRNFFLNKQWYSFEECLERLIKELSLKHKDDKLWNTVKAYNGSGVRASNYANNVYKFIEWIEQAKIL